MFVLIAQSCLILCNLMDCSPQGSSVHGISQARILEWFAISFSQGTTSPKDRTWVSHLQGDSLLSVSREATYVSALQADSLLSEPRGKPCIYAIHIYTVLWVDNALFYHLKMIKDLKKQNASSVILN